MPGGDHYHFKMSYSLASFFQYFCTQNIPEMKAIFSIRPKYKVALSLLMLIIVLLCGVLLERNLISRVNEASTSIYNDRLVPSTAVYHLSDHITQRFFIAEEYVQNYPHASPETGHQLSAHVQQSDSIISAFEKTYLVKKESKSLEALKKFLDDYRDVEKEVLTTGAPEKLAATAHLYSDIRGELMKLSQIQTRVGQELLDETHSLTSNANTLSQLQVVALIITCLVIQAFILASKAINSPLKQKHHLN